MISESPTDVQPVFQAIAERARTLCKADVGATTRLDGDVVHLAGVRALSTQAEDAMRAAFPMAVDAAPPNIRRAIVEQQPIQIADVHAEPGYPSAEVAQRVGLPQHPVGAAAAPGPLHRHHRRGSARAGALCRRARWRCCRPLRARR